MSAAGTDPRDHATKARQSLAFLRADFQVGAVSAASVRAIEPSTPSGWWRDALTTYRVQRRLELELEMALARHRFRGPVGASWALPPADVLPNLRHGMALALCTERLPARHDGCGGAWAIRRGDLLNDGYTAGTARCGYCRSTRQLLLPPGGHPLAGPLCPPED